MAAAYEPTVIIVVAVENPKKKLQELLLTLRFCRSRLGVSEGNSSTLGCSVGFFSTAPFPSPNPVLNLRVVITMDGWMDAAG